MKYLKLIRFPNLVLLAFMQLVFRYGFLEKQNVTLALNHFQFALLILASIFLAAGGYIINDIFDQDIDAVNKPNKKIIGIFITEEKAYYLYAFCTIIGVALGMYLSNVIQKPAFLSLFMFIAVLLYFYASTLKSIALLGNIVVSGLVAFSVLILALFDLYPMLNYNDYQSTVIVFSVLKDFAIFAFVINLIREVVKDCEDIIGDKIQNCKTLPVTIGLTLTNKITAALLALSAAYLIYYCFTFLMYGKLIYATFYLFASVIAPMLYSIFGIWKAKESEEYNKISAILKMILFFGIISIAIITYLIPNASNG
jgi:4-hydroxybenzoate polyprenyltransferase